MLRSNEPVAESEHAGLLRAIESMTIRFFIVPLVLVGCAACSENLELRGEIDGQEVSFTIHDGENTEVKCFDSMSVSRVDLNAFDASQANRLEIEKFVDVVRLDSKVCAETVRFKKIGEKYSLRGMEIDATSSYWYFLSLDIEGRGDVRTDYFQLSGNPEDIVFREI